MKRRDSIRLAALLTLSGIGAPRAFACRLFPQNSTDRFSARQGGAVIGFKSIRFSRESGVFVVDTEMRFDYRDRLGNQIAFSHSAREVWSRGFLDSFTARTRNGGRITDVRGRSQQSAVLIVRSNTYDIPLQISGYVVPSTLWHRDTRLVNRLIDFIDGRLKLIRVSPAGEAPVRVAGRTVAARHFRIRGELSRDVWYTGDCRLVRVVLPLANSAPVIFELRDGDA